MRENNFPIGEDTLKKNVKWIGNLIIGLFSLLLIYSEADSADIEATWTTNLQHNLLDKRSNEECDDIRPRWAQDKIVVVFESIVKGKIGYQELLYMDPTKTPSVASFTKWNSKRQKNPLFSFPEKEESRFYTSYISWIRSTETTQKKIPPLSSIRVYMNLIDMRFPLLNLLLFFP